MHSYSSQCSLLFQILPTTPFMEQVAIFTFCSQVILLSSSFHNSSIFLLVFDGQGKSGNCFSWTAAVITRQLLDKHSTKCTGIAEMKRHQGVENSCFQHSGSKQSAKLLDDCFVLDKGLWLCLSGIAQQTLTLLTSLHLSGILALDHRNELRSTLHMHVPHMYLLAKQQCKCVLSMAEDKM